VGAFPLTVTGNVSLKASQYLGLNTDAHVAWTDVLETKEKAWLFA